MPIKKKHPVRLILTILLVAILLLFAVLLFFFAMIPKLSLGDLTPGDYSSETADAMKGSINLVLYGVDSREGEIKDHTRSDTILLASIDKVTNKIRLVSVYRDTYVYINKEHGYTKVNHAYAYGGPKLSMETLNRNLDLNLQDFVTVNFNSLAEIVDALGGVRIDIQEDEIKEVNRYTKDVAKILGTKAKKIKKSGLQTLDGTQAVGYCRVRYTSGGDFRRAERQRAVVEAMLKKAKKAPWKLLGAMYRVCPEIYTSLSTMDLMALSLRAPFLSIQETTGFPKENKAEKYKGTAYVFPVTLSSNVKELHKTLFSQEDYKPSDTVKGYSATIKKRCP